MVRRLTYVGCAPSWTQDIIADLADRMVDSLLEHKQLAKKFKGVIR